MESKLARMEENEGSLEVRVSVMANFHTEIPSTAQDEQPPLEPFDEVLAGEFNEVVVYNE